MSKWLGKLICKWFDHKDTLDGGCPRCGKPPPEVYRSPPREPISRPVYPPPPPAMRRVPPRPLPERRDAERRSESDDGDAFGAGLAAGMFLSAAARDSTPTFSGGGGKSGGAGASGGWDDDAKPGNTPENSIDNPESSSD